jgi:hypothetical protein
VARKGVDLGSLAYGALALLVLALAGSWAWARFGPGAHRHGAPGQQLIRVQVLNGSGEAGIGTRVATFLREGGYRVVEVRNADRSDYFASFVVSRRHDLSMAREVAHYLGEPPLIEQAWDLGLADVSVVIGSDRSRLRVEP